MFKKLEKKLVKFSLFQALGLVAYCSLVGIIFWKGNDWFGSVSYFGPVFVLLLLSVSVLICGLIVFAFPIFLFWEKKETQKALKLVALTAAWSLLFILLFILVVLVI